jgi:hypothetical protein
MVSPEDEPVAIDQEKPRTVLCAFLPLDRGRHPEIRITPNPLAARFSSMDEPEKLIFFRNLYSRESDATSIVHKTAPGGTTVS